MREALIDLALHLFNIHAIMQIINLLPSLIDLSTTIAELNTFSFCLANLIYISVIDATFKTANDERK